MQGTPSAGDVRTWSGISLTVSDGQATSSLGPFSVNVIAQGAATGSATLSWMPPTERVDGSPIGELEGYEVLWGQRSRDYDNVVELGAGTTRYFIGGLGPGTWYFAIRSKTADGLESQLSQEVSKTI
ncbi:fibronectin type III domain-containing protein [Thioalkalivibrio sp. XN8]|nr:fibronectin type III domain-containing protein [Thioalkalivibrio sp. XN8]